MPGKNPLKSINPAKNEDIKDRVVQQIQLFLMQVDLMRLDIVS